MWSLLFVAMIAYLFFYREPRFWPNVSNVYLTAASHGTVTNIQRESNGYIRIDCFLSLLDMHLQYVPCSGMVERIIRIPGEYKMAFLPESDHVNERVYTILKTDYGRIMICQKAGFVTRRIDNYLKEGQHVKQGDKLGWIHFGSGVSLWIPGYLGTPMIRKGDNMNGLQTVVGMLDPR